MSTEDHSEQNNNLTSSRNHSHPPTPSNPDVNAEASLISSAQLFTTSASLLDCVDSISPWSRWLTVQRKWLLCCEMGRRLLVSCAPLISMVWLPWDESAECVANLVLQDAIERIFVGDIYGDIYAGIYVIRGENVVLLGEIVCCSLETLLIAGSG